MKFEIDQSGKIEQTNKNTILCISNDKWKAVLIKARTKRQIQEIFRRNGQSRNFILFTFSAGLSFLIEEMGKTGQVIIDQEYFGKEHIITKILLEMLSKKVEVHFRRIGRKAMAHHRAYAVAIGKLKAHKILKLEEILKKIKMTEVGKRLKDA